MRRLGAICVLLLLTLGPACAQPERITYQVQFHLWPPASVFEVPASGISQDDNGHLDGVYSVTSGGENYLGCPAHPFAISLLSDGSRSRFKFVHRHFNPEYRDIGKFDLSVNESGASDTVYRFPAQGDIRLEPESWGWDIYYSYLLPHPIVVGSIGLVLLGAVGGVAGVVLRARRVARSAQLLHEVLDHGGGDPWIGRLIGGYRLVEKLGEGGMAVVYRGLKDSARPEDGVAVKLIKSPSDDPAEELRRFRREIQICMQLRHAGLVRLEDYGEQDGLPFLVMELLRGEMLSRYLKRGAVTRPVFGEIFMQLLDAVGYAHSQGIVHRDLKPANIMVLSGMQVKVMDFGIARSAQASTITRTGTALGTLAYMAPEQLREGKVGPAADQYALGVIAYEMLGGRLPIDAEATEALYYKRLVTDVPPPLHEVNPKLPAALCEVVDRMLARQPEDRHPDLAAVKAALEAALGKDPGT